mmetsp:Transcript_32173/g.86170  ORF Transcript_32173/g.86170 Transcript_32173/m.86170 type:complete len:225 (-) Transcript_32173:371-1045(-)
MQGRASDGNEGTRLLQFLLHRLSLSNGRRFSQHCFDGELPAGCLAAQHDRVSSVPHSICQIAHLSASWDGCLDHTLDHLRGCYHKQTCLLGSLDKQLLREGHTIQAQLHPQVASCDHQCLGLLDDPLDVDERLRLLDLGANLGSSVRWNLEPVHYLNQLLQILTLLCERDADVVAGRIKTQEVLCVLHILLRQSRAIDLTVWHVDPLSRLQLPASQDPHRQLRI